MCVCVEMVERHSDPLWEGQAEPGVCPLLLLAIVWGKPALEAQGPRLTSDCSRCIREREGEGGKAEAGRWFLKQPERGPGPTFTRKVGGTFVAWAFLERSCGFQDWGLSTLHGTRFVSAEPCSGVGKWGRRNSEQVSNELA